jgi:ABC-type glycerol-3-phosphate transport system permease component
MVALGLAALFPVLYMVSASLKSKNEYAGNKLGLPHVFTLENFVKLFDDGRLPVWLANSVIVTVGAVALSIVVSVLSAYPLAKVRFRGRESVLRVLVALLVVPSVVLLLPLFVSFRALGLLNTQLGVIIVLAALVTPFSIFMLVSFFREVPSSLVEAGKLDGLSVFGVLGRIVLPLSAPALVTLAVVNALTVWNDLLISLVFLQDDSKRTLMAGLTLFKSRFSTDEPLIMAGAVISILPMVALYLIGQRYFINGLVAGALK